MILWLFDTSLWLVAIGSHLGDLCNDLWASYVTEVNVLFTLVWVNYDNHKVNMSRQARQSGIKSDYGPLSLMRKLNTNCHYMVSLGMRFTWIPCQAYLNLNCETSYEIVATEWYLLESEDRHVIIRPQTTVLFIMRKPEFTYKPACRL